MRAIILFLFVGVAAFSCKDDDAAPLVCGYADPTVMPWLKAKIAEYQNSSQAKTTYLQQGETGGSYLFWFNSCCVDCSFKVSYYNCEGVEVDFHTPIKVEDQLQNVKVIWKSGDNECNI